MAVQPGVWGIDLGQCALKALRVEVQEGQVVATAFDYVEHPKILSQPDADPDQLTREALEKFLSRNSLRGDTVAISVPGQSGLARFVKLPPVEEKKIVDIVRFEAKQQIPFNLDEVVWDYQKIGSGVVTDGFAMETEIGLFAMKRDMVSRYLQHFKDVNVEVHLVQMAPLCLCNYVAYDLLNIGASADAPPAEPGKKRAVVALDIGADSSNLVVTDGQRIIWQRPIPLGGNHFTRALTKDLKLTFAKAEHLKRNATKSGPELKKILTALKPVLNDFVGEVQRSLGYFTNTHRDAQIEYMMGLGNAFRLPGLQRFLAEKLQLDVRKLQKLERLQGDAVVTAPAFTENVLSFAVAYGLGLQGLKEARLQTNLLPPEIQVERMIRAKKPWAAAAAAALLGGTFFGPFLGYALDFRSVNVEAEPLKTAVGNEKEVADKYRALDSDYKKKQDEAAAEEKAVKSIIAGQDERINWIELEKFIADALPRPNGDNLTDQAKAEFFDDGHGHNNGRRAFEQFLRHIKTVKPGAKDDADIDPDLVQVNVTSMDARFTDDTKAEWDRLTAAMGKDFKDYVAKNQADKAPSGSGWLVELRGYTFNRGSRGFVLRGIRDAIAQVGIKTEAPAAGTPASGSTTAPAPGNAPAAADDGNKEPVIDRISNVTLFAYSSTSSSTQLSSALGSSGGGGGGMPDMKGAIQTQQQGMMGGAGGPNAGGAQGGAPVANRSGWRSLLSIGGPQGGGAAGGAGTPSGGKGPMNVGAPPSPGGNTSAPATPEAAKPGAPVVRTDFVLVFFWKERAPSDAYFPPPSADTGGAGGMGGAGMMGGGR
jgi:type IV pilus assembly protein PilM